MGLKSVTVSVNAYSIRRAKYSFSNLSVQHTSLDFSITNSFETFFEYL